MIYYISEVNIYLKIKFVKLVSNIILLNAKTSVKRVQWFPQKKILALQALQFREILTQPHSSVQISFIQKYFICLRII